MYNHFYGFSEKPFADAPDPKFLFLIPDQERTLNFLTEEVRKKRGWILLSGDVGTGKTLFLHHLMERYQEDSTVKTAFIFQTRTSFEDLLRDILNKLNFPSGDPDGTSLTRYFQTCLAEKFTDRDTLLLLFDEAQSFSVAVLEKIHQFFAVEFKGPCALQLIFSAHLTFPEKLLVPSLRRLDQKIAARYRLRSYTEAESQMYLEHRLRLAGRDLQIFTPQALALIIRQGEGIPRTLNILCDNSLRIGHQLSEARITPAIVQKAVEEMFGRKGRFDYHRKTGNRSFFKKRISYALAALLCLALVFWMAKGSLYWRQDPIIVKIEPGATPDKPNPLPMEKPSEEAPLQGSPPAQPIIQPTPLVPPQAIQSGTSFSKKEAKILKVVKVEKGTTLHSLCVETYGLAHITLIDHILRSNPSIANPHLILVNERIKMPEFNDESLLIASANGTFEIALGTFANPDAVKMFRSVPLLQGKRVSVSSQRIASGETWYRLTAGTFESREEALGAIARLKSEGLFPFLARPSR